ncbi:unnamed protein product [Clonostachys rosea f. rosea IK726]|jgi:hypothetical protein|uniref:Uncharacterized protein n=1 Tax=Clonostachys rosea f. rosea IK726 TaxID=1349383 RepID=A0ACA9UKY2_BIOOC|nr:unnamed protein product [Clonostachys rosea f. rosea IK726]
MAPIPSASPLPRLITYFQTHHDSDGNAISVLPLITQPGISLTHLILAAIHINDDPAALTLNDHHPSHPRFQTLWAELRVLQASGIKVMGMLGGAAPGSYQRLDGSAEQFERYYTPVRDLIREHALDGLDLDVEEETSLDGIIRLIDRLRSDFGPAFIITLAPVAAAMLDFTKNLSGFDYEALEVMRGKDIAWYNTQFYCGWGDCSNPLMYNMMRYKGWPPEKLVIGLVTNPENGNGFVPFEMLGGVLNVLGAAHGKQFGGVMGWEYFNSMPGGRERPWEWAKFMTGLLRGHSLEPERKEIEPERKEVKTKASIEVDADSPDGAPPQLPKAFEYHSEGLEED